MSSVNKHGLSRRLPDSVRRAVRQNSKFGCVICRRAFFQYEHIDPKFEDAEIHDPERICCLCGSCHDAVTRGQYSKEFVTSEYARIKSSNSSAIAPTIGPLDFHTGTAELQIGELHYSPLVNCVLMHNNTELIRVNPGAGHGQPGSINAVFTDLDGEIIATLDENGWSGPNTVWDIEVVSNMVTVRRNSGQIVLRIILKPPGKVIVDRLDMRFGDSHLLVASGTYAVGRYVSETELFWVHAKLKILKSSPDGRVIEITTAEELVQRDRAYSSIGASMADAARDIVMSSVNGVMVIPAGIAIGAYTGSFTVGEVAAGTRSLKEVRKIALQNPLKLPEYLARGSIQ